MTPRQAAEDRICVICGVTFTLATKRGKSMTCCLEHSIELNRRKNAESKRRSRAAQGPERNNPEDAVVVILRDPTPYEEGGYLPGARIQLQQFNITLSLGYFASGTVVRKQRARYYVQGSHLLPVS